ncbi:hypothetical protein GEMRC1_011347 [Eukaryota sp. GEM-RC1]
MFHTKLLFYSGQDRPEYFLPRILEHVVRVTEESVLVSEVWETFSKKHQLLYVVPTESFVPPPLPSSLVLVNDVKITVISFNYSEVYILPPSIDLPANLELVQSLNRIKNDPLLLCCPLCFFFPTASFTDSLSIFSRQSIPTDVYLQITDMSGYVEVCIYGSDLTAKSLYYDLQLELKPYLIGRLCLDPFAYLFVHLSHHDLTISTAESVTGGMLADLITRVPGIKDYFKGGVVAYANDSKTKVLEVDKEVVDLYGPVSEEVSKLIAVNIRKKFGTRVGVGITGFASSPTINHPVGTVFVSVALGLEEGDVVEVRKFLFGGCRKEIMRRAVMGSLYLIHETIDSHFVHRIP